MGSKPGAPKEYVEPTLAQLRTSRKTKTRRGPTTVDTSVGRRTHTPPPEDVGRFTAPPSSTGRFTVDPQAAQKAEDKRHATEIAGIDKKIAEKERAEKGRVSRERSEALRGTRGARGANGTTGASKGRLRKTIVTGAGGVKENGPSGKRKTILGS